MKLRTFFIIVLVLLLFGTILSILSLFSPLFLDQDFLSSAGEISSGIAAIFGMAIACLALWLYLNRESTEQKIADHAYEVKERLEEAILQASVLIKLSAETNSGTIAGVNDRLVKHAFIVLREALAEARKAPLYSALLSLDQDKDQSAANHLLALEAHITADLNENATGVSNAVFISIPILWDSLIRIDSENIKEHSTSILKKHDAIDFMKKVGNHIMGKE